MICKDGLKDLPACEPEAEHPNIIYLNDMTEKGFRAAVQFKLNQWRQEDGLIYTYYFQGVGKWVLTQNLKHEEQMSKFQRAI